MNEKTKKIIIIFEIILLALTSLFTGTILFSNYNRENNSNHTESINPIDVDIEGAISDEKSPYKIAFIAKTNDQNKPLTYQWEFGDGSSSTDQNPTHIFKKTGVYQTTLIVSDSRGNTGSDSATITIDETDSIEAIIGVNTWSGFEPLIVYFYGNTNHNFKNVSYYWEYGPINRPIVTMADYRYIRTIFGMKRRVYMRQHYQYESNEQNPIMVFGSQGLYWAKLRVTDEDGNTDTDMIWIQVYDIDVHTTVLNKLFNNN